MSTKTRSKKSIETPVEPPVDAPTPATPASPNPAIEDPDERRLSRAKEREAAALKIHKDSVSSVKEAEKKLEEARTRKAAAALRALSAALPTQSHYTIPVILEIVGLAIANGVTPDQLKSMIQAAGQEKASAA